jgi:pimeloyl-ACP methyl ester carboxylesterase
MRRTGRYVVSALVLATVAACRSSGSSSTTSTSSTASTITVATTTTSTTMSPPATSTTSTTVAGPAGDAFYQPPDPLPPGAPGAVIWTSPLPDTAMSHVVKVLYHSRSAADADVAVSGLVYIPLGTPPAGGWPVLAVAHGTTGLGDQCAPSRAAGGPAEAALIGVIGTPFIVAITDYEGLGTPGVHPYLVGHSEGHSVLDSARAARAIAGAAASAKTMVFGHSQGGGAALWAAELAPTYAPDDDVIGAIAGAPAAELPSIGLLGTTPNFGFLFMAAAGFKAAFPDLDLSTVFTAKGVAAVDQAAQGCTEILAAVSGKNPGDYVRADIGKAPGFADHLLAETPGTIPTTVPIFMYHGDADEIVPVAASLAVLQRMCAAGGFTVERKTYPGGTHVGVIPLALGDIKAWLTGRLAGDPPPATPCPSG